MILRHYKIPYFSRGYIGVNASLSFIGSAPQNFNHTSGDLPSGLLKIDNPYSVDLTTNIISGGTGYDMDVLQGVLNLGMFSMSGIDTINIDSAGAIDEGTGNITYMSCNAIAPAICPAN